MAKKNKNPIAKAGEKHKKFFERYNARETKGLKNGGNALLKTTVDVVGATLGAGLGSALGKGSTIAGVLLIGTGHLVGDKSGILRMLGTGSLIYGMAKIFENANLAGTVNGVTLEGETSKAKTRLVAFKDEALATFHLDKVFKKKTGTTTDTTSTTASTSTDTTASTTVGSIDLSALDFFDNFNEQEAQDFHAQLNASPDYLDDESDDYTVNEAPSEQEPEFAYRIIDEDKDPDFSKM